MADFLTPRASFRTAQGASRQQSAAKHSYRGDQAEKNVHAESDEAEGQLTNGRNNE